MHYNSNCKIERLFFKIFPSEQRSHLFWLGTRDQGGEANLLKDKYPLNYASERHNLSTLYRRDTRYNGCYGNASTRKRLNAEMPQKPVLRNFRFFGKSLKTGKC